MTPAPLSGPFVWSGADMADDRRWQRTLTTAHVAELEAATARVMARGFAPEALGREDFPLPSLSPELAAIGRELESGCGMVRMRGLPVSRFAPGELEVLWMGLCLHLGRPVSQNAHGQLLREIRDEGPGAGERYGQVDTGKGVFLSSRARTASTAGLRFHTDRTDVVALLCASQARSGGISKVASTAAVHNEMLLRRPDLVALLYQPIWRSRLGEESGGEHKAYPLPVFGVRDGKFTSHYSRTYVEAAQLMPDVPKMSAAQWEALDLLAEVAQALCLEMRLQPGDMQFLNNHVIYHARTGYEDDPRSGQVRCLYRIWLCVPGNRALPEDHAPLWRNVEANSIRGGIAPSRRIDSMG